jgi:hypothetical protein
MPGCDAASQVTLLDTTSLVHESYLKLLQAGNVASSERPQFLACASQAMRSIIIDFVRRRRAERRGGGNPHISESAHLHR